MEMKEMVEAVKAHAEANYARGGWDIIVECYDDEGIEKLLLADGFDCKGKKVGVPRSANGAIKKVSRMVFAVNEYRADIVAEAF